MPLGMKHTFGFPFFHFAAATGFQKIILYDFIRFSRIHMDGVRKNKVDRLVSAC